MAVNFSRSIKFPIVGYYVIRRSNVKNSNTINVRKLRPAIPTNHSLSFYYSLQNSNTESPKNK